MRPWGKVNSFSLFLILILFSFFLTTAVQIAKVFPLVSLFQSLGGVYSSFPPEEGKKITRNTLLYLQGRESSLPYTPEEIAHLQAVRRLFVWERAVWRLSFFFLLLFFLLARLGWLSLEQIKIVTRLLGLFFLFLDILLLFFFPQFFRLFHEILFPPGSWQFSPDKILVQLFPYQFWLIQSFFVFSFSALLSSFTFFFLRTSLPRKS